MNPGHLILFMGSEASGMYQIARSCRRLGLPCRSPVAALRNPLFSRKLPAHHVLWYWTAIRRFFEDLRLPPVAQVPAGILGLEQREYYSRLFARSFGDVFAANSFICADHLTALVLPLVLSGMNLRGVPVSTFFFFSHPSHDTALLHERSGQAPQLSEFTWRNIATAAILAGGSSLRIYEAGELDQEIWEHLVRDVSEYFSDTESRCSKKEAFPLLESAALANSYHLAAPTLELYDALHAYVKKEIGWHELEKTARKIDLLQKEQNGWQFVDCLDTSGLHDQTKRLTNCEESQNCQPVCDELADKYAGYRIPQSQSEWALLLDETERKLLQARQNFEMELFLQADNLHHFYMRCLQDEKKLWQEARNEELERRRKRRLHHKERLRSLWPVRERKAGR